MSTWTYASSKKTHAKHVKQGNSAMRTHSDAQKIVINSINTVVHEYI